MLATGHTEVLSEESIGGPLIALYFPSSKLRKVLEDWLGTLKSTAETETRPMNTLALADNDAMLVVRFLLELTALVCFAIWAWRRTPSPWRWLTVVALPVLIGWAWGAFAVSNDPSRSGATDFEMPGPLRLLLELVVFFGGVAALHHAGFRRSAKWLLLVMVLYQVLAYDRIGWLLSH